MVDKEWKETQVSDLTFESSEPTHAGASTPISTFLERARALLTRGDGAEGMREGLNNATKRLELPLEGAGVSFGGSGALSARSGGDCRVYD